MCSRHAEPGAGHPDNEPLYRLCEGCGADSPHVRLYGANTRLCPKCRARDQERWDRLVGEAAERVAS
jgi:NMD protein affecting ribosome stability and mRNA decay